MIQSARDRAFQAVNSELVLLYRQVGEYISSKLDSAEWADGVVTELAECLQRAAEPSGFTRSNLCGIRQFYGSYRSNTKVSALLRLSRPEAESTFKDAYMVDFLNLPTGHSEADLHHGLLHSLQCFLTELGRDFSFVGSEHPIQVGGQDFSLDLLFFRRGLNSLVAIELKSGRLEPEHMGKLDFHLEALDRDLRKDHENPSIGLLLCATKDKEVAEYCMNRSLSPAMVAEYTTQLPEKRFLQSKLQEFYRSLAPPRVEATAVDIPAAKQQ